MHDFDRIPVPLPFTSNFQCVIIESTLNIQRLIGFDPRLQIPTLQIAFSVMTFNLFNQYWNLSPG